MIIRDVNIEIKWILFVLGLCWLIILFLLVMVINQISELRTMKEFKRKCEADHAIIRERYNKATEAMSELSIMMTRYDENIKKFKLETEQFIKDLKKDDNHSKN